MIFCMRIWFRWLGSFLEQAKIKCAGLTFDTFSPDFTVMGFDDCLADRQPQTGAFGFINSARRHGAKFLESRGKIFFRNANSLVLDTYGYIDLVFYNGNER